MKKAIAITELTIIILSVLAGIGLIFLATTGAEKAGCLTEVTVCRNTYALFKTLKEKLGPLSPLPRVDCVAVSPPNCEEKALKTEDRQQTMYVIAENLKYCWQKTLGRENDIGKEFGSQKILSGRTVSSGDVDFCLVCSEFTPNADISDADWTGYLENRKMFNSDETYAKFVNPAKPVSPWGQKYREFGTPVAFAKGVRYYVVSVDAEVTPPVRDPDKVFIYIAPEVYCGEERPQIHYQLK